MNRYENDRNRDEDGEAIFYPDEEEEERGYQPEEERDYQRSAQYSSDEQQPGEINYSQSKTKPRMRTKHKSSVLSKKNIEDKGHTERNPKSTAPKQNPRQLNPKTKTTKAKSSLLSINRLVSIDDPDNQNDKKDSQKTKPKRKWKETTNSLDKDEEISRNATKKPKKSAEDEAEAAKKFGLDIERFIARLEAAAEEDAELNRKGKPAITKLSMLSEMRSVLSKKPVKTEFIERGGLSALKAWLEPLPNKCLPHVSVRSAVLNVVDDLNLDIADLSVKEKLKESRLGHVINFLTKSEEEVPENRKLAQRLINEWCRVIFGKTTNYGAASPAMANRPPIPRTIVMKCPGILPKLAERDLLEKEIKGLDRGTHEDKEMESFKGVRKPEHMAMGLKGAPKSKIQSNREKSQAEALTAHAKIENKMKKLMTKNIRRPVKFNTSKPIP